MKKTLLPLIILAAACCFTSCKKNKKYCWTCNTSVTTTPDFGQGPITSTQNVCDRTEEEIEDMETAGTTTTSASAGGMTITQHSRMTCVKQ